jgi:crotonobetainyl-CoA:carnitine CoA-transferase CaiB-like acyl-CoA transferase
MQSGEQSLIPGFGPLEGLRVLESGRFVAGPWASTYLGEFGAQVIHLEGPPFEFPYADPTRTLPPILPEGAATDQGVSESWVQYSRNKLSVGLDLKKPDGTKVFLDLIGHSDIWIESSRPGTYDRLGLSDDVVWKANPMVTVVHVSGFGQSGDPKRYFSPSYDLIGQAYSGYLSLQGKPDPEPPARSGTALNDTVTGLAAAAAALMGHYSSKRLGRGQSIDVAQYEVFFALLENLALDYFARGVVRGRHGSAHPRLFPYDLYAASDGWVVVAAPTQESWLRLRDLVELPPGASDDPEWRLGHRDQVNERITSFCRARSAADLEALGNSSDVAIAKVLTIADIAKDPHYLARGMFTQWEDPVAGRVQGSSVVPRFNGTPGGVWRGAPWLGQDNVQVLSGLLGYPMEHIVELRRTGVIGESKPRPTAPPTIPEVSGESP